MNKLFALTAFISICTLSTLAQSVVWSNKANPLFNSLNSVTFSANGAHVLSGTNCHPASIRMYNVDGGNLEWDHTVGTNFMCIMGVAFSSNMQYLAAIEEFGNIFIFDNTGAEPVAFDTIQTGTSYGFSTMVSPNNSQLAVGCSNGKLQVYNLPDGDLAFQESAHASWVTCVAYSPNGSFIVTGGSDDKVKVWNSTGGLVHTCSGHTGDVTGVKVTPDGQYVLSGGKDDVVRIWSLTTGQQVATLTGHMADVNSIDISPDGSKVVSGASNGYCKIWDLASQAVLSTFGMPDSGSVNTVSWSPLGDRIATGNSRSDLVMWSVPATLGSQTNLANAPILMYPNPATDRLHIKTQMGMGGGAVVIRALDGRVVSETLIISEMTTIDLAPLSSGLYHLIVNEKQQMKYSAKLVVE